jgi:hypothetical protein
MDPHFDDWVSTIPDLRPGRAISFAAIAGSTLSRTAHCGRGCRAQRGG